MNDMITQLSGGSSTAAVPLPRVPIAVRLATVADVPFMDALQKVHAKQVGFFPTKQFEGNIRQGKVLIAEERHEGTEARRHEGGERAEGGSSSASLAFPSVPSCLRA